MILAKSARFYNHSRIKTLNCRPAFIIASMRRIYLLLSALLLTACQVLAPLPAGTPEPSPTPNANFTVIYHPDGLLYVGDQVSVEIVSPAAFDTKDKTIRIELGDKTLGEAGFQLFGIGARKEAVFYWVWDTSKLSAGDYTLTFSVHPTGNTWKEQVSLLPVDQVPAPEPEARWETAETTCCTIYYVSGTDAARDIEKLKAMADAQFADVLRRMDTKMEAKIPVTFLPRTLGHGGFASDGIYVSYLDQNYAGSTTAQVVHHEMVHWVDARLGGDFRPTMLVEGLAVYMSDGHFKVEPILPRTAALLDLNWYIPLRELINTFYFAQHEIGYMEGAALIGYLVQTYGWEPFNAFYRDIHPAESGQQADALDAALQAHFGLTLAELETNFIAFLRQQPVDANIRTDMRLTVTFYDMVRRYQRTLDPSAYFLTAWLVDGPTLRERGIVADYLRHPHAASNQRIEALLVSADAHLRAAEYGATEADLRAASLLLDWLGK
jgi:hypothetical protein